MLRVLGPALVFSLSASADAPHVALPKGFTPNPVIVNVHRAEGGAAALGPLLCKDAPATAMVSKSPAAVLEVPEGIAHLDVLASNGDVLVARTADGVVSCGGKSLSLNGVKGTVELFVVTGGAVDAS